MLEHELRLETTADEGHALGTLRVKNHRKSCDLIGFMEIVIRGISCTYGKTTKNPAPNEGAGHSQGERRLLVICAGIAPTASMSQRVNSSPALLFLQDLVAMHSRKAHGVPTRRDGDGVCWRK
jgi:hypothetical protein